MTETAKKAATKPENEAKFQELAHLIQLVQEAIE